MATHHTQEGGEGGRGREEGGRRDGGEGSGELGNADMWCTLVVSYRGHVSHGNVDSILDVSQLIVLRTHKTRRLVITGCHWRGGEGWEGRRGEGREE